MHLADWFSQALGNWQGWLSGGGIGGLVLIVINLVERLGGWQVSKKWYAILVLGGFFCGANYVAWNSAFLSMKGRETDLRVRGTELTNCSNERQEIFNKCLLQIGKVQAQASGPVQFRLLSHPGYTDTKRGLYSFLFLALVDRIVVHPRGKLVCEKPFNLGYAQVFGAAIQDGGADARPHSAPISTMEFDIATPNISPADPLIFTLYTDNSDLNCSLDLQVRQKNSWVHSGSGSLPSEW